jgi:hypothetical protein
MAGPGFESLKAFLETAPAARRATRPLAEGTEVGLTLDGAAARFRAQGGRPVVSAEPPAEPDFTLTLPPGAVDRLTALPPDDIAGLGVAFFQLVVERDPAVKIRVHLQASTGRLLSHGWLSVLALGGLKVILFFLKKGITDPKGAIDRLRGK